ncbi:MAG TPA: CoA pyrophosphatase [Candidatus Dormibacteraeota bacterium]
MTPEEVRARLAAHPRRTVAPEGLVAAAVAVGLLPNRKGVPCFLLTRRTAGLRQHAGQWALPGGRLDAGESPQDAARRELEEELGIPHDLAEHAGELDDYVTRSGYLITPVVVLLPAIARLRPNPAEVAAAYRIPLALLDAPLPGDVDTGPTVRFRLLGRVINPPTAAILHQLSEVVVHGRPTRVAHFAQPRFTWT